MQVSREDAGSRHQTFLVFAFAFAKQLLVPFVHHGKVGLKSGQGFHNLALAVQDVAGHRITISIVILAANAVSFAGISSTFHQGINVDTGTGDGQQTNGSQNRVTAANIIRNNKSRPALCISQLLQGAFGTVSGGINALVRLFRANGIFQQLAQNAERQSGFGGGTGFRNNIDGETLTLGHLNDVVQVSGRNCVTAEINLQAVLGIVVIQTLDCFDNSACAQVRAADTGDQQHIGIFTDLFGCFLDTGELFLVIINRQVQPAQKIIASTGTGFQLLVGKLDLREDRIIFFGTDKLCKMFAIVFDTHRLNPPHP